MARAPIVSVLALPVALSLGACGAAQGIGGADAGPPGVDATTEIGDADGGEIPLQSGLEVEISSGRLRGLADGDLRIFKGIPFAEPPIGNLRFRAAVPVAPWNGTLAADAFGPSCPQVRLGPEFLLGDFAGPTSEDCLSLNVWAHRDARVRPVMVFVYGGGFITGGTAWPIYEASRLARRTGAVVVTMNYRLGVLGFLTTEALAAESGQDRAGNYGILDQVEALRWVQKNIRAFGGDPGNVTLFGESAGAISVCALLGAPAADGLFHKAIMESGMCVLPTERGAGPLGAKAMMTLGQEVVAKLGCSDARDELDCLRTLPAESLANASSLTSIFTGNIDQVTVTSPHVDGMLIPEQPLARLRRGEADLPFITGSNENEGLLFAGSDVVLTWGGLEDAIQSLTGAEQATASAAAALYPFGPFPTPNDAWIAFLGDVTFICPGLSAAAAAAGGAPSYTYHFTRSPALTRAVGASHAMELFYVFGTFDEVSMPKTQADERVVEAMQRAWGSFAAHGAPELEVTWPPLDPSAPAIAILDDPPSLAHALRSGRCDALGELGFVE